jgi:hypothetical protein
MGATTSAPKLDLSNATVSIADAQRQLSTQVAEATSSASSSAWGYAKIIFWILGLIIVIGGIGTVIYYFLDIAPKQQASLNIISAKLVDPIYGPDGLDVTAKVQNAVKGDALFLPNGVAGILTASDLTCQGTSGTTQPCTSIQGNINIAFQFQGDTQGVDKSPKNPPPFPVTQEVNISIANETEHFTNKKPVSKTQKAAPSLLGRIKNVFNYSGSSADLLPYPKDATSIITIPSASAPLSSGQEGAYGMQFWMYIKDWNYKFGEEKHIVSRSDPTNPGIMNPSISLHPTDNSLKISVSVFGDSSSSKSEPAPAGHSGSTDDVFMCEVPDIPLQTWVAVSVTLFSRNLDVYLNGKLVKSCLLSGVPKQVAGDIELNAGGGFSGYLCSFYNYPRMLTPTDAQSFFSQGTSCTAATDPSSVAKATGYGFKFGVYDAAGKQLSQYVL